MKRTAHKRILLVEDSRALAIAYRKFLQPDSYHLTHVADGATALAHLEENPVDLVILDLVLPDMSGLAVLESINQRKLDCRVLIITAHGSVDFAVQAMRLGAADFLEKPFDRERLRTSVGNLIQKQELETEVKRFREEFNRTECEGFVGGSLEMQAVYRIIESAASSKAAVFISGETGTGKEVCAQAIHSLSNRSDKEMVALNCAAIPRELMESEIFGHVKGAFTGANSDRQGAASRADGSTLFLDEICEMDLDLQSKLLRFIQTGSFQKVGGNRLENVDIRFVCATNRNVLEEVRAGRFREDLYYRLHVVPIALPPLRERIDDIEPIASRFLEAYSEEENKSFGGFSAGCLAILEQYSWPGNIRQLQNVLRNIVVLNDGDVVTESMLPHDLLTAPGEKPVATAPAVGVAQADESTTHHPPQIEPLWISEKRQIEAAIADCDGNVPRAAALLEVSASTLYRKIQKWRDVDRAPVGGLHHSG